MEQVLFRVGTDFWGHQKRGSEVTRKKGGWEKGYSLQQKRDISLTKGISAQNRAQKGYSCPPWLFLKDNQIPFEEII